MKKKTFRDELVTKGYLTDKLADFSEALIDQIDSRMDKRIGQVEDRLDKRIDRVEHRIDQVESNLDKKFDRVYISLDKVIKELQDMREEDAAGNLQERRLEKKVEDHEKRIKNLESQN